MSLPNISLTQTYHESGEKSIETTINITFLAGVLIATDGLGNQYPGYYNYNGSTIVMVIADIKDYKYVPEGSMTLYTGTMDKFGVCNDGQAKGTDYHTSPNFNDLTWTSKPA